MTTEPLAVPDTTDPRLPKLREAIAQHPQYWQAMGDAWKLARDHGGWDQWANGQLMGFMRGLGIVGGFDLSIIERTLEADFGG